MQDTILLALSAFWIGILTAMNWKGDRTMKIQVAGPGCPRCQTTEKNVFNACAELNLDADISHVTDLRECANLGVRPTPNQTVTQ